MDRMLYIAASGASQSMYAQAINAHNLANVSTAGFRSDLAAFQALHIQGPGQDSRAYAGIYQAGVDFTPGSVISTGNELDMAVNGDGWIVVQAPDGTEALTRAGDLRITSTGILETGAGHPVMGNGGAPVALPPFEKLEVAVDGTISVRPLGQGPDILAVVDRIKLVNPPLEQMEKGMDGLLRMREGFEAVDDATVTLVSGAIESSNVNAVQAMVSMIDMARQFEMQMKLIKTAQENDAASAQLMRLS